MRSILPVASLHGINEFLRVVANAVLKNHLYIFNIRNPGSRIALDEHEISILAGGNRSDLVLPAEVDCAVHCGDFDGFLRRESSLYQQFDLALVAISWNDSAVAGGIWASQQQSSRSNEFALQLHIALEERGTVAMRWFVCRPVSRIEIRLACFLRHRVQHRLSQRWTPGHVALKHRQR